MLLRRAHPRACGENRSRSSRSPITRGSSPRMRGKLIESCLCGGRGRLIPAHAGKTLMSRAAVAVGSAHPRACGENTFSTAASGVRTGSSPRMRGKRVSKLSKLFSKGLIPAHAGKTSARRQGSAPPWAHPRACGENFSGLMKITSSTGSSPRMRGKPHGSKASRYELGLIPAHAGKTLNDLEF